MKLYYCLLAFGLFFASPLHGNITANQFRFNTHPRVFATKENRELLWNKIQQTPWANAFYTKIKAEIDPLVERHVTDPQFIVSRLQMHWEEGKHYTHFYTDGNFIPRREGNAPYPTVRLCYGRAAPGTPSFPKEISIIPMYGNGDLPVLRDGQWQMVPFDKTQLGSEQINKGLIDRAYYASIVYYFTGEKKYAKFAADILWTFIRGASYQEQVNPDQTGGPFGYLSWETLGDTRRFEKLPLAYDFIHDYLVDEYFDSDEFKHGRPGEPWAPGHQQGKDWALKRIEIFFKKFIENKLTRGGGLKGNWNTNEHQSAMLYALAMENNEFYSDGKGREYYVDKLIYGPTTPWHGAYIDVAKANINPDTGLWPEPPGGYGQGSIQQLVRFGFIYALNGIDLLNDEPLLRKAAISFPQMAFPNGYSTGWGDSNYNPIFTDQAEFMIAYARMKGDTSLEDTFTALLGFAGKRRLDSDEALFFFVPELKSEIEPLHSPRTSYSPDHSIVFGRNTGKTPTDSLAYTVSGFGQRSGHRQANGMTMELYGRGHVLGVDPGIGPDYWHEQHHRYNINIAAHNTVVPNGKPADLNMPQDLKILYAEPSLRAGQVPETELSPWYQFTDTFNDFKTREISADQRRTIGIVRINPTNGYYIDIFRSRVREGKNLYHDYLYHNQGRSLQLKTKTGSDLPLTDQVLDPASGFGYEYFADDRSLETSDDFRGIFIYGVDDIRMNVWMLGESGRTVYSLTAPNNWRHHEPSLRQLRVPTMLVRQVGEAWNHPFVAIYEPSGAGAESMITDVQHLKKSDASEDLVAVMVQRTEGMDYIFNSTSPDRPHQIESIHFQGIYAVITEENNGLKRVYLGKGKKLLKENVGIELQTEDGEAYLQGHDTEWQYTANTEMMLYLPFDRKQPIPKILSGGQPVEPIITETGLVVRVPAGKNIPVHIQSR